jgi:hypothetical protein
MIDGAFSYSFYRYGPRFTTSKPFASFLAAQEPHDDIVESYRYLPMWLVSHIVEFTEHGMRDGPADLFGPFATHVRIPIAPDNEHIPTLAGTTIRPAIISDRIATKQ